MNNNIYIEIIDARKDALGRQVFFLGFDDPKVGNMIRFQVFNAVLQNYIEKWVSRGYDIVFCITPSPPKSDLLGGF